MSPSPAPACAALIKQASFSESPSTGRPRPRPVRWPPPAAGTSRRSPSPAALPVATRTPSPRRAGLGRRRVRADRGRRHGRVPRRQSPARTAGRRITVASLCPPAATASPQDAWATGTASSHPCAITGSHAGTRSLVASREGETGDPDRVPAAAGHGSTAVPHEPHRGMAHPHRTATPPRPPPAPAPDPRRQARGEHEAHPRPAAQAPRRRLTTAATGPLPLRLARRSG